MTWHPNSAHARAAASTKTSSLHHVHLPSPPPTHTPPPPVQPVHGDGAGGAARRRRERRLRSWWKHDQQSVKPAVFSALHHSRDVGSAQHEAPRGQKKTTEEEEAGLETHLGLRAPTLLPPRIRPASLAEPPGAQERVQRHTAEQFGDPAPHGVQILDAPVPQSGDQLVETLKNDVELAIQVPKIFLLDYTPQHAVHGVLQLVEQLVDEFRSGPSWHATETWRAAFDVGPPWGRLMVGYSTLPVVPPPGITASTGRYISTGQGGRFSTRPCIWQSLV